MKKETMKQNYEGYEYKGIQIFKYSDHYWGVSWCVNGKTFYKLKEARQYIDNIKP